MALPAMVNLYRNTCGATNCKLHVSNFLWAECISEQTILSIEVTQFTRFVLAVLVQKSKTFVRFDSEICRDLKIPQVVENLN